jgi:hypothetical protein
LRAIRYGGGGAHMLKRQSDHIETGSSPKTARKKKPIRCEPRWRAADASLKTAIGTLTTLLKEQERNLGLRQRRRRADDEARFRLAVECVACNLLAVSIGAPDRPLAIPLANAASQIAPIFGKPARKVIDLMAARGLLTKVKGFPFRGPTTVVAKRKLSQYLPLEDIAWSALHLDDDPEVIKLNKSIVDDEQSDDEPIAGAAPSDPHTRKTTQWFEMIAAEMHGINAAIRAASIQCDGSATVHIADRPGRPTASLVTRHHRTLRRTFNETWEQGGRLFGGFWQTMPRADRFECVRLEGEFVAVVDYSQLFLRLAYAEADVIPPSGDLYDVTGCDGQHPNWERLRDARKKLVNALFFRQTPLRQWPGATLHDLTQMRSAFPKGTLPRDAIEAIKQKHAPIAGWFEHGHGLRFMRTESDMIAAVTSTLIQSGAIALPIHDAVLVRQSHAPTAKAVMEGIARHRTGAIIPAEIKTSIQPGG